MMLGQGSNELTLFKFCTKMFHFLKLEVKSNFSSKENGEGSSGNQMTLGW